jgi:osmoprotectant transport system ATP-binding protein
MGRTPPTAIAFQDVSYAPQGRSLVSGLTLSLEQGQTLALLGRSGCGKTTTLKLINRLLLPTQGEVFIENIPTARWNPIELRRNIGYVIQDIGLFPHFTVEQNIGLVPTLKGWNQQKIRDRVAELLDLVGLDASQFAQRYPHQLSGGQRQRIGVARALAVDPPILLMDEPFSALDPITRLELQQEFRRLQQRLHKTIVWVTHDVQEALLLGTQIGLMHHGMLLSLTTPAEFLHHKSPEAQDFLSYFHQADQIQQRLSAAHPLETPYDKLA